MATDNPMGDGRAVPLQIPTGNLPFLRTVLTDARDGLREDLDRFGDQLREPREELETELADYGRLLIALETKRVRADCRLYSSLLTLADSIDRQNEYPRVRFEHKAMRGLLAQIEAGLA